MIIAKTEPLFPKQIASALRSFSGPLSEDLIEPCCAQYAIECSNASLDLPNGSGATFAIACGLSFSLMAKNYAILDANILASANLPSAKFLLTMPDVSLTFSYPCILYLSLLAASFDASMPVTSSSDATPGQPSLEVITSSLLGMVYGQHKESLVLSSSNIAIQRADFANVHSASSVISCLSMAFSAVRLDIVSPDCGILAPVLSFAQSDTPSATIYMQWEGPDTTFQYIIASFGPLHVEFSEKLNEILMSVDLTRNYLEATKSRGRKNSKNAHSGAIGEHQSQSAFRLLADLLASETVSTSAKQSEINEKAWLTSLIACVRHGIVNIHIGQIEIEVLGLLHLKMPKTSILTPNGSKHSLGQQMFPFLMKPVAESLEEKMFWTIKSENIILDFSKKPLFNTPLTVCATLSAIQSPSVPSSTPHSSSTHSQQQLSLHINLETISFSLHRSDLKNLNLLQNVLLETFGTVARQIALMPFKGSVVTGMVQDPPCEDLSTHGGSSRSNAPQIWIQVTVPKLGVMFYLENESSIERRLAFNVETAVVSIDHHPLYHKIRCKIQTVHGEAERHVEDVWEPEKSYFLFTNSRLFDLNYTYQASTPGDIMDDELFQRSVSDDFVITITKAKVRDVFQRIHDVLAEPVTRTTSGELFAPSRASVENSMGLTEICINLPNIDFAVSQEVVGILVSSMNTSQNPPSEVDESVQGSSSALYLNSGVVRNFINLQTSSFHNTSSHPVDFLLLCCRISITSDVEFATNRSRQPTAVDNSMNQPHDNQHNNNNIAGHCDSHMHFSFEQLSAHVGNWQSLSQNMDSSSSFGRLSPHIMNNPALHWNMKQQPGSPSSEHSPKPCLFPILASPIDISLQLSPNNVEIIFRQQVELLVPLNILPALVMWSKAFTATAPSTARPVVANRRSSKSDEHISNSIFELTLLCPELGLVLTTFNPDFSIWRHFKAVISRPQLIICDGTVQVSCQNVDITAIVDDGLHLFRVANISRDQNTPFAPVVTYSLKTKNQLSQIFIKQPIDIRLNQLTMAAIVHFSEAFDTIFKDINSENSLVKDNTTTVNTNSTGSKLVVDTSRVTVGYEKDSSVCHLSSLTVKVEVANTLIDSNGMNRCKSSIRIEKLLSLVSNTSNGYVHCSLQPTDIELVFDIRCYKVNAHKSVSKATPFIQKSINASATPIVVTITEENIQFVNEIYEFFKTNNIASGYVH